MKKPKAKRRAPTQEELLKRAQETEEKNVIEHRDYLKDEEEKRERARVVRPVIEGRLIRWVSKVEEEIVHLTPPASPTPVPTISHTPHRYTIGPGQPPHWGPIPTTPGSSFMGSYTGPSSYPQPATSLYLYSPPQPHTPSTSNATRPLEPLPAVFQRKRKEAKNYVVLENAQTERAPRVTWKQTMEGMFGDHVRWEDVRVYSTKNRPMCKFLHNSVGSNWFLFVWYQARPRERCPITGMAANYVDPRTGIPYANAFAFQEIGKILEHEYVWNEEFGCYVGQEEAATDEDGEQEED